MVQLGLPRNIQQLLVPGRNSMEWCNECIKHRISRTESPKFRPLCYRSHLDTSSTRHVPLCMETGSPPGSRSPYRYSGFQHLEALPPGTVEPLSSRFPSSCSNGRKHATLSWLSGLRDCFN